MNNEVTKVIEKFKEVKNIEENMKVIVDETNKSKWDNYSRK